MNEYQFVTTLRDELAAALPGKYTVRTDGGDETAAPPVAIIEWGTDDITDQVHGHSLYAGEVTDSNGDAIGEELHSYERVTVNLTVRSFDEQERDNMIGNIRSHFAPISREAGRFDPDTFEWELGGANPSSRSGQERDWYTFGKTMRCGLLVRTQDTENVDTLTEINETLNF